MVQSEQVLGLLLGMGYLSSNFISSPHSLISGGYEGLKRPDCEAE
jgi:hypothetical protein